MKSSHRLACRVCIRLGKRLNPAHHASSQSLRLLSVYRPGGWPSARHACPAPVTPSAYRRIKVIGNASCHACAPGRSQPCYSAESPFVGRSVRVGGRGTSRRALRESDRDPFPARAARSVTGTRVAVFPSVRGGTRPGARERPPTAPFRRVVSACDTYRPIIATQSRRPPSLRVSGFRILVMKSSLSPGHWS